jgi:hypothetical protein
MPSAVARGAHACAGQAGVQISSKLRGVPSSPARRLAPTMPRDGAIIFRYIVGKLDVLKLECDKCGRRGRYRPDRTIERYGIDAKLFDWTDEITADCPRKQAMNLNDMCGVRCPDLPKVV